MEGKTDLCTFCFLKTDEEGLTGLLKHSSNTGLNSCQSRSALLDDMEASVLICYQWK